VVLVLLAVLVISLGAVAYLATRPVEIEFAQDPNPLELSEANRKIKLLNEAREAKKKGFVRLSEVEINSFMEARFHGSNDAPASPSVALVKSAVLLHQTNLTLVTWHRLALFGGFSVPFVWQRTVAPVREGGTVKFEIGEMRLGRINLPLQAWPQVSEFFGRTDAIYEDRRNWLASLPKVALMKNEISFAPELRLFSYDPDQPELAGTASPP
jgi:hypothetical protein